MTTATANAKGKQGKEDTRDILSVNATPDYLELLDKLKRDTGLTKRRLVLIGLYAFANLNAAQRESLIKKHPLTA